jgi:hypothetical protein
MDKAIAVLGTGANGSPANETLVAITDRIYFGELKPDPSNLNIALELLNAKLPSTG